MDWVDRLARQRLELRQPPAAFALPVLTGEKRQRAAAVQNLAELFGRWQTLPQDLCRGLKSPPPQNQLEMLARLRRDQQQESGLVHQSRIGVAIASVGIE